MTCPLEAPIARHESGQYVRDEGGRIDRLTVLGPVDLGVAVEVGPDLCREHDGEPNRVCLGKGAKP